MGKPDIIRMKECVDNIKSDSVQDKDRYFDELELLVEDIDNAKDFVKSGLFDELFALADSAATKDSQLLANILWIMATIVQNNAYAKKAVCRV